MFEHRLLLWWRTAPVQHRSTALNCDMIYAVYLPPHAAERSVPVVYYLSGLTCTDENFVIKAEHSAPPPSSVWPSPHRTPAHAVTACRMIQRGL